MEVCIIDQEIRGDRRHQIMIRRGNGFYHVFPGKLFTKEDAHRVCSENGYTIVATGNIWQCLN